MDKLKQKFKDVLKTNDQDRDEETDVQNVSPPVDVDTEPGQPAPPTERSVGFSVGFSDDPQPPAPERKERRPRFADMDDDDNGGELVRLWLEGKGHSMRRAGGHSTW
jgi:hypothetical protein